MSIPALLLVVVAAAIHTAWNLLVKQAGERQIFMWWGLVCAAVAFSPAAILQPLPTVAWPYAVGSGLAEAVYFAALTYAYRLDDFSLVYPIARGTAPLFLFFWTVLLLGEQPKLPGVAGLSLIILGLTTIGADALWQRRGTARIQVGGIGAALSVAVCISVYSVIDGSATRLVPSLTYLVIVLGLTAIFLAPFIFVGHGRRAVFHELRTRWQAILLVGGGMLAAYLLVLYAYSIAKVSYVGAVREVSIVFAAWVGWRWLGERFGVLRVAGALLLLLGIFVIALVG